MILLKTEKNKNNQSAAENNKIKIKKNKSNIEINNFAKTDFDWIASSPFMFIKIISAVTR